MQIQNGYKYQINNATIITINKPEKEINFEKMYYLIADSGYILHNMVDNSLVYSEYITSEEYFNDLWEEISLQEAKEKYNFEIFIPQEFKQEEGEI